MGCSSLFHSLLFLCAECLRIVYNITVNFSQFSTCNKISFHKVNIQQISYTMFISVAGLVIKKPCSELVSLLGVHFSSFSHICVVKSIALCSWICVVCGITLLLALLMYRHETVVLH